MSDKAESSPQRQVNRCSSGISTMGTKGSRRARGTKGRSSRPTLDQIFGESLSSLSRDECGYRAEGQAERQQWESWLRNQKPPHYSA